MSTVPNPAQKRAYPIDEPAHDSRFTLGLVFAVAQVLADFGFPPIVAGGDLVELQQLLYGFIYRVPGQFTPRDVAEVLDGEGPIPPGLDAEMVAAARRIARHFADHGCLVVNGTEDGGR